MKVRAGAGRAAGESMRGLLHRLVQTRRPRMATQVLYAEPYPLEVVLSRTALLLIDFQNDFCSPGGWADLAGLDLRRVAQAIPPAPARPPGPRPGRPPGPPTPPGRAPHL